MSGSEHPRGEIREFKASGSSSQKVIGVKSGSKETLATTGEEPRSEEGSV